MNVNDLSWAEACWNETICKFSTKAKIPLANASRERTLSNHNQTSPHPHIICHQSTLSIPNGWNQENPAWYISYDFVFPGPLRPRGQAKWAQLSVPVCISRLQPFTHMTNHRLVCPTSIQQPYQGTSCSRIHPWKFQMINFYVTDHTFTWLGSI